jgi:hypothetical protein
MCSAVVHSGIYYKEHDLRMFMDVNFKIGSRRTIGQPPRLHPPSLAHCLHLESSHLFLPPGVRNKVKNCHSSNRCTKIANLAADYLRDDSRPHFRVELRGDEGLWDVIDVCDFRAF